MTSEELKRIAQNIKKLRKSFGETQEELGEAVNVSLQAISMYERGERVPPSDILEAIANHYNKTTDDILHGDFLDEPTIKVPIGIKNMVDYTKSILPLVTSDTAMQNKSFRVGYEKCCYILESSYKNKAVPPSTMETIFESFGKAAEEDIEEATPNLLWLLFLTWQSIANKDAVKDIMPIMFPKKNHKIKPKDYLKFSKSASEDTQRAKQEFLSYTDELVNELIQNMKSDPNWSELGDYYLALRYITNYVDSGLTRAMNGSIGNELMFALSRLKNKYAENYIITVYGE